MCDSNGLKFPHVSIISRLMSTASVTESCTPRCTIQIRIFITFKGRHDFRITDNVEYDKKASTSSLCRFCWGTDQEPAGTCWHCLLPYESLGVIQTKSQLMNGLSTNESVTTSTAFDKKIDYMWDITWTYHLSVTLLNRPVGFTDFELVS